MSGPPTKRARIGISAAKKQEICQYKEENQKATQQDIARHFSLTWGTVIGRSRISSVLMEKDKWLSFPMQGSTDLTRGRSCKKSLLESALSMWLNDVQTKNLPVNSDMIIEKAKKFGGELVVVGFSYSNGWLERFKKRHGILLHKVHGESNKVNLADVKKSREELRCIISENELSDVHNMDETGLFYRLEHDAILATGPVKRKKKKEQITVALCANATGMDKQKPLLIARTARPRCFGKDFDPNVYAIYRYNKKAWMTRDLFTEWLENFERTMRSKKRKILLLLDNATSHEVPEDLQNVRVHFLPPNMTSHLQPNDAEIIRNFKLYYRKGLTKHFLRAIEDDKPMSINLREALRLIKDAWNDVKSQTINKSWEHTGIIARRDLLNDDPTEIGQAEIKFRWIKRIL